MHELMVQLLWRVTLALILVVVLRRSVRRFFGATAGYLLWMLLPVLLLALCLPSWGTSMLPAMPVPTLGRTMVHAGATASRPGAAAFSWGGVLFLLWFSGCVWKLVRMVRLYSDTARLCRPMSESDQQYWRTRLNVLSTKRLPILAWHPHGPALLGALRPRLLLPLDFQTRHTLPEQDLILQHELAHQAHRDGCWNLVSEVLAAVLWFHPLLPFALRRFRLDQEVACDCAVLSRHPHVAGAYGRALLNTHSADAVGIATHWLEKPKLKERMTMLKLHSMSSGRRRLGFVCVLALVVGTAWAAQNPAAGSSSAAAHTTPPTKNVRLSAGIKPRYPLDAIKNKQTGTVIVKVKVNAQGRAEQVRLAGNKPVYPSLAQAAMDWASRLVYNPAVRNGKQVTGWTRIPVTFSLKPLGKTSKDDK